MKTSLAIPLYWEEVFCPPPPPGTQVISYCYKYHTKLKIFISPCVSLVRLCQGPLFFTFTSSMPTLVSDDMKVSGNVYFDRLGI